MDKKSKEISNWNSIKNIFFAMKLMWGISKRRIIFEGIYAVINYGEWIFFDAYFMRYIVDALDHHNSFQSILKFIVIACIVCMIVNAFYQYQDTVFVPINNYYVYKKLYAKLYKKARNVELRCFEDADFYNKYTMALDKADTKVTNIVRNIWMILFGIVGVVIVFYNMYTIDPFSVIFILFPAIGNFGFAALLNKNQMRMYQEDVKNVRIMQYVNRVMYLADYSKDIRLTNIFQLMRRKYQDASKRSRDITDKYSFKNTLWVSLKNIFQFCIIFEGVLLYGAYECLVKHKLTLAKLTVLTTIMVAATWILIGLFDAIMNTIKDGMFIHNLRVFLDYEPKIPEDYDGIMPEDVIESIEFRDVSFSYQDEQTIKHLSFVIHGGDNVALVGHNGAGKSTIIKLLLRLYDPTQGEILLNGRNIKEYNLRAYRDLFAVAFQDYKILAMSVKDNVLMGREEEHAKELVEDALIKTGAITKIEQLSKGIETNLTKEFEDDGAVLSGGQYQKIVVARTFAKKAPVKVFDEPSSALDPIAEYDLYTNIMKESEGKTVFFISHRLSSVKNANLVFMLEKGEIIERGNHIELMRKNGSYADMYKKQAMNYLATEEYEGMVI